jgi:hypothetical protein
MSRAIRRHHRERLKKRTRKILSNEIFAFIRNDLDRRVNVRWNNMQMCSCPMCGNPRRWDHKDKTLQELKAYDRYSDGLEELSLDP